MTPAWQRRWRVDVTATLSTARPPLVAAHRHGPMPLRPDNPVTVYDHSAGLCVDGRCVLSYPADDGGWWCDIAVDWSTLRDTAPEPEAA